MQRLLIAFAAMFVGCVQANAVSCPDGSLCGPGSVCLSNGGCASVDAVDACDGKSEGDTCTLDQAPGRCSDGACGRAFCGDGEVQFGEACDDGNTTSGDGCNGTCSSDETCGNGVAELGEQCDCGTADHPGSTICNGTVNGGTICNQMCGVRRCGDDIMDPGEVCDDGNLLPGDGCNATCSSDEVCGNGVTDFFRDEQCDDGNTSNLDSCSVGCAIQPPAWRLEIATTVPAARVSEMIAYDAGRKRIVMFGGDGSGGRLDETHEFDGARWLRKNPPHGPRARSQGAMVFDAKRGRVVLFGGDGDTAGLLDDTWEYDGTDWRHIATANRPEPRRQHAMAYDAKRGVTVLFGGRNAQLDLESDTWEYDGIDWTMRTPAAPPNARASHVMAYDAKRNVTVMYGGNLFGGETWEYNGTTWTRRFPSAVPPNKAASAMVFDVGQQKIVLAGGGTGATYTNETWEYDGTTWLAGGALPANTGDFAMAYDIARRRTVAFGGAPTLGGTRVASTIQYTGTSWLSFVYPLVGTPPSSNGHAMAYDESRDRVVLYGGEDPSVDQFAWDYDGIWRKQTGAGGPSARAQHAMVYDADRRRSVVFGGQLSGGLAESGETWELVGSTWTPIGGATPGARYDHAMTYDRARKKVVLFGGSAGGSAVFGDTWEYDGAWTRATIPGASPSARHGAAMAFDERRNVIVLFGGEDASGYVADTWEFDGATWTPRTFATLESPSPRIGHVLVYDVNRGVVVMFGGGFVGLNGQLHDDTWEFDPDVGWIERTSASHPDAQTEGAAIYDRVNGRVVMFTGDFGAGSDPMETWSYAPIATIAPQACSGADNRDGDTVLGCADDECAGRCGGCGNGTCDVIEDCRSCPADCAVGASGCLTVCGDFFCDPTETATCPGDCL